MYIVQYIHIPLTVYAYQPYLRRGSDRVRRGSDRVRRGSDRVRRGSDRVRRGSDRVRRASDRVRRGFNMYILTIYSINFFPNFSTYVTNTA